MGKGKEKRRVAVTVWHVVAGLTRLTCMSPSIRPTVCVMNWVDAACRSCSSHVMGIIRQPSRSKILKKLSQRTWFDLFAPLILTWSYLCVVNIQNPKHTRRERERERERETRPTEMGWGCACSLAASASSFFNRFSSTRR